MSPERIQLRRVKGWKMPPNTVKVDRTTKWGNPFTIEVYGRDVAVEMFCWYIKIDHPSSSLRFKFSEVAELRGKNLACWCPLDKPCHADVLLETANRKALEGK